MSGRLLSMIAIKERFWDLLKALIKINLESKKKDERDEAFRIKKSIENFEFVLMISGVARKLRLGAKSQSLLPSPPLLSPCNS